MNTKEFTVAVIGAGTMGQGIVQLALQAGHSVILLDQSTEQLQTAYTSLENLFEKFVNKNKISFESKNSWLKSLKIETDYSTLSNAHIVIEAIVERLDIKKKVFLELESIVSNQTILATNTSSLSITAIAAELSYPNRFIGLHFFNPPGIMPLVEVIDALQTSNTTTETCIQLMREWGKTPVRCKNTPGFIVNRVARPFYVESFRLLEDQIINPTDLDACIRGAGFKMGPCELTDFIGQDINYAVSCSLFNSLFYPSHLRPSYIQGGLVEAKYLGRKSGKGFYDYSDEKSKSADENKVTHLSSTTIQFASYGKHPWLTEQLSVLCNKPNFNSKVRVLADEDTNSTLADQLIGTLTNGVALYGTDGHTATEWEYRLNAPVILADIKHPDFQDATVALAFGPKAAKVMQSATPEPLGTMNWIIVDDCPGLINLRVISMIINEAMLCATQGIADPDGIDAALRGGVNYPMGAFEWLSYIGTKNVANTLQSLRQMYGSDCYVIPRMLAEQLQSQEIDCESY